MQIREARESDVPAIREIFRAVYGDEYPYHGFFDEWWLKRSVFTDDILMLVAEDDSGRAIGTASVVFDVGAHSDLTGEFGRLAVIPDARKTGAGRKLMEARLAYVQNRLHVGIVENRCTHEFSQRISIAHGFAPVGFLPMKHLLKGRESVALFARFFGGALGLRKNHPRIVPEGRAIAALAMSNCGIEFDAIVDEGSTSYSSETSFITEELAADDFPSLLRIERGRIRNREVFGPMRLQYGFFKLSARRATYLVARSHETSHEVAGAIGYIRDDEEKAVRVFELISPDDSSARFLFEELLRRARLEWNTAFVEVDVSAHAPRMQRTLVELGFIPAAYLPAGVFHEVERLDVIKMILLLVPLDTGTLALTESVRALADQVMKNFHTQAVAPRIAGIVRSNRIFQGLSNEQILRVAGLCAVEYLEPGSVLFNRGDEPESVILILDGSIHVTQGNMEATLGPGEILGEVSALTGQPHSGQATVQLKSTAAVLTRDDFRDLCRLRPDIGLVLYKNVAVSLSERLRRANER